jgi:hypothetical protein
MTAASAAAPAIAGLCVLRSYPDGKDALFLGFYVSSQPTPFFSGNGKCNHLDGKCKCWPGYEGASCDTAPNRMYRESWGLFFSICLLGTVFIGIVCASMTRLRALPEPFIAIVFGLLIGVAVNIFSVNPGTLRNMQVRLEFMQPFHASVAAAPKFLVLAPLYLLPAQHHFPVFFAYDLVRARLQPRQVALFQKHQVFSRSISRDILNSQSVPAPSPCLRYLAPLLQQHSAHWAYTSWERYAVHDIAATTTTLLPIQFCDPSSQQ